MKIFDAIKRFFSFGEEYEDDGLDWYEDFDVKKELKKPTLFGRRKLDLNDQNQMEKYIVSCCEQMKEAGDEIEEASGEYRLVTEYLMDMENLANIEPQIWTDIENAAAKISSSDKEKRMAENRTDVMVDEKYNLMERYEDDVPAAVESMKKNEEYKVLVREDLKNLEGEKVSYRFRDRELKANMRGAREVTVVIIMAVFFIVAVLLSLQYLLEFDVSIGYFLVVALAALAMTLTFLSYSKAKTEDEKVSKLLNEAISTQNTVKIRFVNVTNLLDYQYAKYKVNSSNELAYMWEKYIKEKQARTAILRATAELEGSRADLVAALKAGGLKYPEIWLKQSDSLLDDRELREIRHDLITRRQGLRKRVDYNENVRKNAGDEIKNVMNEYPKHSDLIISVVGRYE